jgi:Xaa-Pro aminopeptidase
MDATEVNYERLVQLREERAARACEELDVGALIATQYDNVQYLADIRRFFVYGWEPNAVAVMTREGAVKSIEPTMYICPGEHWRDDAALLRRQNGWDHYSIFDANLIPGRYADWLKNALRELGVTRGRVGVDGASAIMVDAFKAAVPEVEFVHAEEALLLARAVKNEEELKLMRKAAWVATEGVKAGLDAVREGVTDFDICGVFMGKLYELGSEGDGFNPLVASGPVTGPDPVLFARDRALQEGDAVIIDMGPIIEGYNGDCMRTGVVGEPSEAFKELYRVNHEAMYAGIDVIKPGIRISEVDAAVRKAATSHGYVEDRYDTGHGIGLSCCELPICMKAGTADAHLDLVLEPGMCFTLEPKFHKMIGESTFIQAGLEESVIVTDDGVEVLTPAPFIEELLSVPV